MGTSVDELSREPGASLQVDAERDARPGLELAGKRAPRVFAVTCPLPPGAGRQLRVEVAGRSVTVSEPGFRHIFELPADVTTEQLDWQVHANVLELRAPYVEGAPPTGKTENDERSRSTG
jgi:hypothetical protein